MHKSIASHFKEPGKFRVSGNFKAHSARIRKALMYSYVPYSMKFSRQKTNVFKIYAGVYFRAKYFLQN